MRTLSSLLALVICGFTGLAACSSASSGSEIGAPPASGDSVFAMVKVGCDYNSDGAANWEWFELQVDAANTASILWSGSEPPACHRDAKQNDYVESSELSLSSF